MKMTITRALAEVKLLNNKLQKLDNKEIDTADVFVGGIGSIANRDKEALTNGFNAHMSGYRDLSIRLRKIKAAIARVNTEKKVLIPIFDTDEKAEFTIYEAILVKSYYENLLNKYREMYVKRTKVEEKYARAVVEGNNKVDKVIEQLYSNKSSQISNDIIAKTKQQYSDAYKVELVEVITLEDIEKACRDLEDRVTDIDLTLSEVNATTMVTVED